MPRNRPSAINDDDLAGDVGGGVGGEEEGDAFQLAGGADAGDGVAGGWIAGSTSWMTGSARREWKKPGAMALTLMPCGPHDAPARASAP